MSKNNQSIVALNLLGTVNNDTQAGGAGSDTIHGNAGNDYITGGNANDFLFWDSSRPHPSTPIGCHVCCTLRLLS
ncbi:MAG: hypothetical protein RMX65_012345 [Nostoc sp. DedQUE01]